MRYVWLHYEQYFGDGRCRFPMSWILPPAATWLRTWDAATAQRVDRFVANSRNVAARIRRYYGRDADVVHPFVDTERFTLAPDVAREDFYLVISALVPYKRIDQAIAAARRMNRRLVIIGTGIEHRRLRRLADARVSFLGWGAPEQLVAMLRRARALLFPGEEDFGIVPLEAMACGTPVVAYAAGGALETLVDGETGVLYQPQTDDALVAALERLDRRTFSPSVLRARAESFSRERFRAGIAAAVRRVLGATNAATPSERALAEAS
jgi:glycosyltransferase involved in cell wall biosynthesis